MDSDYLEYIYRMMFHVKHCKNTAVSITGRIQGTLAKFRYELCASCRHRALCLRAESLREWRLISARSE